MASHAASIPPSAALVRGVYIHSNFEPVVGFTQALEALEELNPLSVFAGHIDDESRLCRVHEVVLLLRDCRHAQ